jgi:hypothetical protein
MIKVMTRFSEEFVTKYYDDISESLLLNKIPSFLSIYPEAKDFLDFYCSNFNEFITSEFDYIISLQKIINNRFPIISESYTPNVFYSNVRISQYKNIETIINTPLRGRVALDKILSLKSGALRELTECSVRIGSHYVRLIRGEMTKATEAKEIKSICKKFKKLIEETSNPQENMPEWVKKLTDLFSYDSIPVYLLKEFVTDLSIDFCPMCNESKIGFIIDNDSVYRPALDHFLPKSKYPHLSLSMYNLIPSCYTCNTLFKRDKDTFTPMHANPYVLGADNYNFFDLDELVLNVLYNNSSSVRVRINSVTPEINNNIKLFKTLGVYNKKSTKEDIISLVDKFKSYNSKWKNYMDYDEFIEVIVGCKKGKEQFEIQHGKLKRDMIDVFSSFKW